MSWGSSRCAVRVPFARWDLYVGRVGVEEILHMRLGFVTALAMQWCAAAARAQQTLAYTFETATPAGPDGFFGLGATVSQDTIGATHLTHSMKYAVGNGGFVGARTETVLPPQLNDPPGVTHVLFDIRSPSLSLSHNTSFAAAGLERLPAIIARAGDGAARRFIEFFVATIRNRNTRTAYSQAVGQFCRWCDHRGMELHTITPVAISAYVEELTVRRSAPTVKQHLAAIRMLFDWLVTGHIVAVNPAWSVRGPRHVVKKGKTPVLDAVEARHLLDSIDTRTFIGLRDRALIALMCYSFARVSAVVGMNVEDYYRQGKRSWFRLHEKGGKFHEVPAHHNAKEYLDEYIATTAITDEKKSPLFRSAVGRTGLLTSEAMTRSDVLRMVKRRAAAAGIGIERVCCHTFRATGITAYLDNGGTIENAQAIAAHESPRTTKLYDRTADVLSLDEIERIAI
jgi:integrase/recombinase XerD